MPNRTCIQKTPELNGTDKEKNIPGWCLIKDRYDFEITDNGLFILC